MVIEGLFAALHLVAGALPEPLRSSEVDSWTSPVPVIEQYTDRFNCGPSASAMLIMGLLEKTEPEELEEVYYLRDAIGQWTWENIPERRVTLNEATTAPMLIRALEYFSPFHFQEPPRAFSNLYSTIVLLRKLYFQEPFIILVKASILWENPHAKGNHWIVIRGISDGKVVYNDSAYGIVASVPMAQLWDAWDSVGRVTIVRTE